MPCSYWLCTIPRNITDVRSLFGLINQVSYCQSSSEELRPFRELLSPSTTFYWDDTLGAAFAHAKSEIIKTSAEGVKIFDKRRKTCLSTDWCKYGIGFSLGQKHCSCPSNEPSCCQTGWKLTFASNRYTHNAEENYAPVEGNALAVAWALDKARHFVIGCNDLIVATDHKPLLKVLGDRKMEDIKNAPLQPEEENTTFPVQDHARPGQTPLHLRQLVQVRLRGPKPQQDGPARRRTCGQLYACTCKTSMEPGAVPHEQRGGLQPRGCCTGRIPDTRGHDNIIVHRIGHLGQRQRTDHQRSHHEAVARYDPDGIPRRQQKHARTHPHLPPVQGRSLHCGGGDTLPGQNRNPAITP